LPDARARQLGLDGPQQVTGLPVRVESAASGQRDGGSVGGVSNGTLSVHSFGRAETAAAGVKGLLLRLSPSEPKAVNVSVGYNGFRWAYGGDWASRLRLWAVPECALTTPTLDQCRPTPLASDNNTSAGEVSGTVTMSTASTLVALDAGSGGAGGDYKATSLSPSATWNAGGNSGDFSWSYALRVPPGLEGPAPEISLNYSSSGVDGRMASTNNQASMIGEGFDWSPGHIERRYTGCAEDMDGDPKPNNTEKTGDQCWETDNASIAMAGRAGELIKDGSNSNRWHLRQDDGTFIEHKTGGPNNDNDGEWWLVRTPDGTEYWFGGRSGSNSTLTVPVYGNHNGEPCHQTAFASSYCAQGYRWQLDHVVDPTGNTMSYTYLKETNKYGRNNKPEDDTVYDRDGYIEKIEYGSRTGDTTSAPVRVLFTYGDRCLSDCATHDAVHWPDLPWDQECTAADCHWSQNSPTFWTKKRLATVKTQVWSGLNYRDVELWTLTHSFPSSDQPTLWLEKIAHTGLAGGTKTTPDITFVGVALPNRVDTNNDQYPAMNRYRMKTINSETGGKTDLTYTGADCVRGTRVPDKDNLQSNGLRCYPVKWQPEGQTQPITDFFHKYLISDVVEADLSGTSSRVLTHYDYVGDPAWHYTDDDGFIKKENKTWAVWRGYGTVRTVKGDPGEQQVEERRYFRGMHGDKLPSGTRSVQLPAIAIGNIPAVNDEDTFAGQARETITTNGVGGAEVSATASEPYQSAPTASRTINGLTVHARFGGNRAEYTRTALDGGRGYRTTASTTTFDSFGMPVKVEDLGDTAVTDDQTCTLTDYVRNTTAWIVDKVSRVREFGVDCTAAAGTGLTDADIGGDEKTSYDQQAWNVAPSKGLVSKVERLNAYNAGNPSYYTESTAKYDARGRQTETTDARGAATTFSYTPVIAGPQTGIAETSPLGWTKTTVFDPAFGLPLTTADANGRKVDLAYDPLGRLINVWLPGRDKATQSASIVYDYLIRNNAPTVVTTKRLNAAGGYITSYQLYDNLLRNRQTQESDGALGVSAVVTDTYYDSAGRAHRTHDPYVAKDAVNNPVPPSTNLFLPTGNIPSIHVKQFDGAGRETMVSTLVNAPPASPGGTEKWRTTKAYGGDREHETPPSGGVGITTISDAEGRKVELRHYHLGVPPGGPAGYDRTAYTYDRLDRLIKVTDPAGLSWHYQYNVAGRNIKQIDPDKGTSTTVYNDAGDVLSTTDGEGRTIAYTYDAAGRKTTMRDNSDTGPKRAEWVYDQLSNGTFAYGQLVKTIRYEGADQYVKEHLGYTIDYKPTSVRYTIPNNATASGVNGSYNYVYTYNQDGSPLTTRLPGMGDLGLETLTYGYNALGKADTLDTSLGATLIAKPDPGTPGTEYTSYGEVGAIHLRHNAGQRVDIVQTYETDTRRLAQIWTTKASGPANTVADVRYRYDATGNVQKISNLTNADHQCFAVDHMRQLKEAWTPSNDDCAVAPSTAALGGPASYWHSYTYDAAGNRTKLVKHAAAGDTTVNYDVNGHRLASTSNGASYTYDLAGNTKTRPAPGGGSQNLTWDAEGHLASVSDSSGTTTFVYDVDGTRLLRKDPTGKTLYLPGQELRYNNSNGLKNCTRYYTHADDVIAVRSASGVVWLAGDHHNTAQIAINAVGQAVSTRLETPFGESRSGTGAWPSLMDKGFVGGTNDNTGLTHLGAREYDPLIGRFISVDPVIDNNDPQQMNGYNYANNAPMTASDPDGQWPQFLDKAVSKVTNAVSNATNAVVNGVKAAGQWVYDNAGTISTVLSVAAIACSVIPPLQVAAPFLGAAATAVGAIETYKSCKSGAALDCAMGLTDLVPGGRVLGAVGDVAKAGKKALDKADDVADAAKAGKTHADDFCELPHSFQPSTPVVMADGSSKPIAAVEVGDEVLATDPQTGQTSAEPVTVLHRNEDRDLTTLTVSVSGQPETIETTWHHPFWDVSLRQWVDAAELQAGHQLQTLGLGTVTVVDVDNGHGREWMHDLTVADVHTYYVIADSTPVLVHNCGGSVKGHTTACTCATGGPPIGPRNASLAGGTHPKTRVPFDAQGFPDFSAWRHPTIPDVRIKLSGSRPTDFRRANAAAGIKTKPKGYTWHHHQDCGLMQLVKTSIHRRTGHTGGFSIC